MKKTIFMGLGLLFATVTFAQTTAEEIQVKSKNMLVTGVASYRYQKIKSSDLENSTFEFAKSGGFFVSNSVLVGAVGGYSSSIGKIDGEKQAESKVYSGGAFGRYFYSPNKQYSFFNEVSVVYASGETTSYNTKPSRTVNVDGIGGEISLGFIYFVTKRFGVQASIAGLTYASASFDEFENSATQGFVVGGDLTNLRIGAVIKL